MNDILKLINESNWIDAIKKSDDLFKLIDNDKNLFHYACMRGNEDVINQILLLESNKIYISDNDGNTCSHLLIKNGWYDILFNIIEKNPHFLKLKNNNNQFIYDMIIDKPDMLIKMLNIMKNNNMTQYLNYIKPNESTFLLDIIDLLHDDKNDVNSKYFEIIKSSDIYEINWNIPKRLPPLIYLLNFSDNDMICKYVIDNYKKMNVDLDIQNDRQFTPLIISLLKKRKNIILKLLSNNVNVNNAGPENRYVPLNICFLHKMFNIAQKIINMNVNYDKKDNLLNTPIYYLIDAIGSNVDLLKKTNIRKIFADVLENSDLDNENFMKVTPMHLLLKYNLWKEFKDVLVGKKFNLNILDKNNDTPTSYLSDDDIVMFTEITNKQINKNKLNTGNYLNKNQSIIFPDTLDGSGYGVFNANSVHNIMYLLYILEKYDTCTIPMQYPLDEKYSLYNHILKMQHTVDDPSMRQLKSLVSFNTEIFFPIISHMIFWRDKNVNYYIKNMNFSLRRAIKSNKRFIIVKLTLLLSPQLPITHANIIIYDKKRNTLMRFEPYGDWELVDSYFLDNTIIKLFKESVDKSDTNKIKYLRPTEYLDKTKFQTVSLGDEPEHKNLGDPEGYCLAWCYWFLELKILNPDIDEKKLVESALTNIISKSTSRTDNVLLEHIRGYAKHLDIEKNKLFDKIGIDKNDKYKTEYITENLDIVKTYVDNYVIKYLSR